MSTQQSDAQQWAFACVRNDLESPNFAEPMDKARKRLHGNCRPVGEHGIHSGRFLECKFVNDRNWQDKFAGEARVDPRRAYALLAVA